MDADGVVDQGHGCIHVFAFYLFFFARALTMDPNPPRVLTSIEPTYRLQLISIDLPLVRTTYLPVCILARPPTRAHYVPPGMHTRSAAGRHHLQRYHQRV